MKLYEIHDAIERILADPEMVSPETGEISEAAIAALDGLEMRRDEKALAVARYLVGERVEAEAVKAQADRLAKRAAAHAARAERLKHYIEAHLPEGTKLRDDVVSLHWSRSTSVFVPEGLDLDQIPEAFVRVRREVDKKALGDALKAGDEVPAGVRLQTRPYVVVR